MNFIWFRKKFIHSNLTNKLKGSTKFINTIRILQNKSTSESIVTMRVDELLYWISKVILYTVLMRIKQSNSYITSYVILKDFNLKIYALISYLHSSDYLLHYKVLGRSWYHYRPLWTRILVVEPFKYLYLTWLQVIYLLDFLAIHPILQRLNFVLHTFGNIFLVILHHLYFIFLWNI